MVALPYAVEVGSFLYVHMLFLSVIVQYILTLCYIVSINYNT